MSDAGPPGEPPRLVDVARNWRAEASLPTQRKRARLRRIKVGLASAGLLALAGLMIWMVGFAKSDFVPVKFIGIGISDYRSLPPHPGGKADVELLREALSRIKICESESSMDDSLEGPALLDKLQERLKEAAKNGERAIIYISLHGIATEDGDVRLLTIKSTPADLIQPLSKSTVSISELISRIDSSEIDSSEIQDVLLLLDVGGLPPDWDLGVLADAEPHLLKRRIDESLKDSKRKNLNLVVLCSHSKGQLNWQAPGPYQKSSCSNFGRVVADAFLGNADRESDSPNNLTQTSELIRYIEKNVNHWSENNRGVQQNVMEIKNRYRDVTWFPLPNEEVAKPDDTESAPNSEPTKTNIPIPAPNAKASKDAPITAPALAENETPKSTEQVSPTSEPVGASPPEPSIDLASQTLKGWKELNALEDALCEVMPNEYESLVRTLARAESDCAFHLEEWGRHELQEFTKRMEQVRPILEANPETEFARLTLAFHPKAAQEVSRDERKKFDALFSDSAKRQPPMDGIRQPPPSELPLAISTEELQVRFVMFLMRKLRDDPSQVSLFKNVLDQLDIQGYRRSVWPLELHYLERLATRWPEMPAADRDIWKKTLSLRLDLATLQPELHRLSLEPLANAALLPHLQRCLKNLQAAERWLLAPGTHSERAKPWLVEAKASLDSFRSAASSLRKGRTELNRSLLKFPEYAAWLACYAESIEDRRIAELDEVGDWTEKLRKAVANPGDAEVQAVLDAWPKSTDPFLLEMEPNLFRLWVATRKLRKTLQSQEFSTDLELQVKTLSEIGGQLLSDMRSQVASLEGGAKSSSDWVLRDRTFAMSWITAESRAKLREIDNPSTVPDEVREQIFSKSHGVWMGFWGGLTNDLISDSRISATHWTLWAPLFRDSLREGEASETRPDKLQRVVLGQALAQDRSNLRMDYEKSLSAENGSNPEFLPLGIDRSSLSRKPALDAVTTRAAVLIVDSYLDRLPVESPVASELKGAVEGAGLKSLLHQSPRLRELENVECSASTTMKLPYVLEHSDRSLTESDSKLLIELNVPNVQLKDGEINSGLERGQVELEVGAGLTDDSQGTIALLNKTDGFPLDVRPIRFIAATDPTRFSVHFVTKDGRKPERIQKVSNVPGKARQYRLMMAPNHQFSLRPVLQIPKLHKDTKVVVRPQYRDAQAEWKELFPAWTKEFKPDEVTGSKELPLEFEPKESMATVDLVEGIRFQIEVNGELTEVTYIPEFRGPEQFVPGLTKLQPDLEIDQSQPYNLTLTVPTERPITGNLDLLLPEEIPIELKYDSTQVRLGKLSNKSLEWNLPLGQPAILKLPLDKGAQKFEFSVDVAGWPHALRYEVDDSQVNRVSESVRVRNAPEVLWLLSATDKPLEPLTLKIEVDAPQLDDVEKFSGLKLNVGIRGDSSNRMVQPLEQIPIRRSRRHEVSFSSTKDRPWEWKTSLQDYQCKIDVGKLPPGRRFLVAELEIADRTLESTAVPIALDDTLPVIEFNFPEKALDNAPVKGIVTARDEESGVKNLLIWLDMERQDSQPQPREILYKETAMDLQDPIAPHRQVIEFKLREKLGKSVELTSCVICARCENGAKQTVTEEFVFEVTSVPSAPGNTPAPAKGELSISFENVSAYRGTFDLTNPALKYSKSIQRMGSGEVTFEDLEAGTYTLTAKRGSGTIKSVTVKIGPGESKVVAVPE